MQSNLEAAKAVVGALRALGRLEPVDDARVAAFLWLAQACDLADPERPGVAAVWKQYREAEAALREAHDGATDAFADLLATLRDAEDPKPKDNRRPNRKGI